MLLMFLSETPHVCWDGTPPKGAESRSIVISWICLGSISGHRDKREPVGIAVYIIHDVVSAEGGELGRGQVLFVYSSGSRALTKIISSQSPHLHQIMVTNRRHTSRVKMDKLKTTVQKIFQDELSRYPGSCLSAVTQLVTSNVPSTPDHSLTSDMKTFIFYQY
jgi:hypothetical protein